VRRASLQLRVAAAATLGVALVLLVVSLVTVTTFANRERSSLDTQLQERAQRPGPGLRGLVGGPGGEVGQVEPGGPGPRGGGPGGPPPGVEARGNPPPVISTGGASFVRLIVRGQAAAAGGNIPSTFPVPNSAGLSTVTAGGDRWRMAARRLPGLGPDSWLQVAAELKPLDDRIAELRNRLIVISAAGILLAAIVAWALGALALRPLRELGRAVSGVSGTTDLSKRLPTGTAPEEVDAVAGDVNAMLGRLQRAVGETERALSATRQFAADAGHELRTPLTSIRANVDALARNPGMEPRERQAALGEVADELARLVALLDSLQALARGDAGAALPRAEVDLVDLLDAAVTSARRRHPGVTMRLRAPEGPAELEGWPDGLRLLADNLLENAARHGRPGGEVDVSLAADDGGWRLAVDDDGPGVPAGERQRIFERFARGAAAGPDGFGLGLALVAQQATLHGGDVAVGEGELGGARFTVRLPRR
jgi:two-component system sensor histidine kinase PrrB